MAKNYYYYYPYGGNRGSAFSTLTTKRFTGQYHESGLPGGEGLSYYNARWYDAQLGRFVSADTVVPNPANPQALNRLAYTLNNPLGYTDPSGHYAVKDDPDDTVGIRRGGSGAGYAVGIERWDELEEFEGPSGVEFAIVVTSPLWGTGVALLGTGVAVDVVPAAVASIPGWEPLTKLVQQGVDKYHLAKLRLSYEREVRAIGVEAKQRLSSGQSVEDVARWAHAARRSLGVAYKNLTPPEKLQIIYQRNLRIYGDKLGPTIDYLRNIQGKSWEEIIESAARPGGRDLIGKMFGFLPGVK